MVRLRLRLLTVLVVVASCGCARPPSPPLRDPQENTLRTERTVKQAPLSLMPARKGFQTRIVPVNIGADGPAKSAPPDIFKVVHYPSPAGKLVAYLSPDPGDGRKHPAIVWAHGGFGGIDDWLWKKDDRQDPGAFREAGIIVMCPAWRGENDNPGHYEMFYGEVNDAVAAVNYLSKVPYVDPKRVYMGGHSTGGTITLLAAEATNRLRAAFSFGGSPDVYRIVGNGQGFGNTPFDYTDRKESELRSPLHFVTALKVPTFYFEGEQSAYPPDARRMAREAQATHAPFQVVIIPGGTHFNILQPLTAMLAQKILADSGPTCRISIDAEEAQIYFQQHRTE